MCRNGQGGPVDVANAYIYYALPAQAGVAKAAIHYAEMSLTPPDGLVAYLETVVNGPLIEPESRPTAAEIADARRMLLLLA
jgi:hypothetical protein